MTTKNYDAVLANLRRFGQKLWKTDVEINNVSKFLKENPDLLKQFFSSEFKINNVFRSCFTYNEDATEEEKFKIAMKALEKEKKKHSKK